MNFDLSPAQKATRSSASNFANTHLKAARSLYGPQACQPSWEGGFRATRPLVEEAVKAGIIKSYIPVALGGTAGSLFDTSLLVEEFYAVETSASLTILGTSLGLAPVIIAGSLEQHEKFLKPFLVDQGAPLASFVFSEPNGSANYAASGCPGLATVAKLDNGDYVLDGEKIWATNCSGWDDQGAQLQAVVCRIIDPDNPSDDSDHAKNETAILVVTREDIAANSLDAFSVIAHPPTVGHTAVNGPHIRYKGLRVPAFNLIAPPGKGFDVVEATFTASAALVGSMGVGLMRQAFEKALAWAKSKKRGSEELMIQKQSVADLLIKIKIRCETARMLTWKACHALEKGSPSGYEIAYEAKIYGSETAVESIIDAINLMGVAAYHRGNALGDLLNDAIVLPIFDGGNVGVRRRQIEKIFANPGYQPWETTFGPESEW